MSKVALVADVSRITTGTLQLHPEEVTPALVLNEAIESLRPAIAAKELHLTIDFGEPGVTMLADPVRLRQIFWNLLSNAVKFTPPRGSINIRAIVGEGHVEISIQDSGRGISKDFLPHVFEIFRQADPSPTREVSGMGLGLNLVKRFVELQGRTVVAQSRGEGHGATFTCRFPVSTKAARDGRARASVMRTADSRT